MKAAIYFTLAAALSTASLTAQALAIGPKGFQAAKRLSCVLAQESLGYLGDDEFGDAMEAVLGEFEAAESDVVYSQALGYYNGLLFGVDLQDNRQFNARLRSYLGSQACSEQVNSAIAL